MNPPFLFDNEMSMMCLINLEIIYNLMHISMNALRRSNLFVTREFVSSEHFVDYGSVLFLVRTKVFLFGYLDTVCIDFENRHFI